MDSCDVVLTSNEILLESIFHNLNLVQLVQARAVCKFWRTTSDIVLDQRASDMRLSVLTSYETSAEEDHDVNFFEEDLEMWKKQWKAVPTIALVDISCDIDEIKGNLKCEMLPATCQVLAFQYWMEMGIVACDSTQADIEVEPMMYQITAVCNMITLPKLPPKVAIELESVRTGKTDGEKREFLKSLEPKLLHPDLKFLLFFCTNKDVIQDFVDTDLKKNAARGVVVTGCILNDPPQLYSGDYTDDDTLTQAELPLKDQDIVAMFFKGKNVQAASVCIDGNVKTVKDLDRNLVRLKIAVGELCNKCNNHFESMDSTGHCDKCRSQMVGFMIADPKRVTAYEWYDDDSDDGDDRCSPAQEQEAFRLALPKIPLFGGTSACVIGDSINVEKPSGTSAEHPPSAKTSKSGLNLFKTGSTVFSVLFLS